MLLIAEAEIKALFLGLLLALAGVEETRHKLPAALVAGLLWYGEAVPAVADCGALSAEGVPKGALAIFAPLLAPLLLKGLSCLGFASCLGLFGGYHTGEELYPEPIATCVLTLSKTVHLLVPEKDLATLSVLPVLPDQFQI